MRARKTAVMPGIWRLDPGGLHAARMASAEEDEASQPHRLCALLNSDLTQEADYNLSNKELPFFFSPQLRIWKSDVNTGLT